MRNSSILPMTGLILLIAGFLWDASAAEGEAQKRQEFIKAYNSQNKDDRKAAVRLLAWCIERATLEMLIKVVVTDKEKDVRMAAFQVLAAQPENDASASALLAKCFRAENEAETKHEMAGAMKDRKFKFDILSEIIGFLTTKCSWPDVPEDISPFSPTGHTPQRYAKEMAARGQFHNLVLTINALTGQKFTSDKKTTGTVRAWWIAHGAEFQKADNALQAKLREEATKKLGPNP